MYVDACIIGMVCYQTVSAQGRGRPAIGFRVPMVSTLYTPCLSVSLSNSWKQFVQHKDHSLRGD